MKISYIEQLLFARRNPRYPLVTLTSRAMPIAARVVTQVYFLATSTRVNMPAKLSRTAPPDRL